MLQGHDPMPILGIPPIVVAEPVHVHLELARIHVHVRDEVGRYVRGAILVTAARRAEQLYFIRDLKSLRAPHTN